MPARLPPPGLAGLDPAWSRLIVTPGLDGVGRTWHVLDNGAPDPTVTLLCVHGNPTWSYLWRDVLARAGPRVRVVAVDQLEMGFSERTGTTRRLQQRVDDLCALTDELDLSGRIVTVAHDSGGPDLTRVGGEAPGPARRRGPDQHGGAPARRARGSGADPHGPAAGRAATRVRADAGAHPGRARAVSAAARQGGSRRVSRAVPVSRAARRHRRVRAGHPPRSVAPERRGASIGSSPVSPTLGEVPALFLWGPSDPVLSDLYLRDLEARLPEADVHRFVGASHLVSEDADVAGAVHEWVAQLHRARHRHTAAPAPRAPAWAGLDRRAGDTDVAMIEMTEHGVGRVDQLRRARRRRAAGRGGAGGARCAKGDRVALLIPPDWISPCACTPAGAWAPSWCSSTPASVPAASVARSRARPRAT